MMISQEIASGNVMLTARHANGAIRRYELDADQGVFIGKSANCGLQIDGESLSDIHCRVGFEDGALCVQDWMSTIGTRVNGELISSSVKLSVEDIIEVGLYKIEISTDSEGGRASDTAANPADASPESDPVVEELEMESFDSGLEHAPQDPIAAPQDSIANLQDSIATLDAGEPEPSFEDLSEEPLESVDRELEFAGDLFDFDEEETYDRETVQLLQAEIEDLRAALAERDAQLADTPETASATAGTEAEPEDEVLLRMQELVEEANRSDERVALLEEMLHASEDANRSEVEERTQLEGWVADIERRIGQREDEHAAEIEAFRKRLEEASEKQAKLQKQLARSGGGAPSSYEETLENLQRANASLEDQLADAQKQCRQLEQRCEEQSETSEAVLRGERAEIAKERAKISRLRFELSSKLKDVGDAAGMEPAENQADREAAHRIRTLREHLREIHEQEKKEEAESPLTTRLKRLWKRVEY